MEKHLGGEVVHIELANQVSFLNRAALARALDEVPRGGHVLLDAQNTDYIDPDVLDLIRDFKEQTAPARGVEVSLLGFRSKYQLRDQTQYVDYSTRELQSALTPQQVLQILKDGHERFRTGRRLTRDLGRQVNATAGGQHPLAVVLSCIDSRTPAELIFDLGVGDIFSVRIAGNVTSRKVLGSMEYGVRRGRGEADPGHGAHPVRRRDGGRRPRRLGRDRRRGHGLSAPRPHRPATSSKSIDPLALPGRRAPAGRPRRSRSSTPWPAATWRAWSRRSSSESRTLDDLVRDGRIAIVGAMYDVATGDIEFLRPPGPAPAIPDPVLTAEGPISPPPASRVSSPSRRGTWDGSRGAALRMSRHARISRFSGAK